MLIPFNIHGEDVMRGWVFIAFKFSKHKIIFYLSASLKRYYHYNHFESHIKFYSVGRAQFSVEHSSRTSDADKNLYLLKRVGEMIKNRHEIKRECVCVFFQRLITWETLFTHGLRLLYKSIKRCFIVYRYRLCGVVSCMWIHRKTLYFHKRLFTV